MAFPTPRLSRALNARFLLALMFLVFLSRWGTVTVWQGDLKEPAAEEATPESSPAEVPGAPAQQRALHLSRLGIDSWHRAGFRGQGITLAVLDSGFRGYRKFLGKGLPSQVTVHSFRNDRNLEASDNLHGVLCAEVLHAIVPEARLLLANWEPGRPQSFLDAVRWARQRGARILSCSIIMPSWSDGEGGGAVHAALSQLVGSGIGPEDLLFFACAGNTAQRHWAGSFHPDARGFHQWSPRHTANTIRPWGKDKEPPSRVAVELYGHLDADLELTVFDEQTGASMGESSVHWGFVPWDRQRNPKEGGCASVHFLPQPNHVYQVYLRGPPDPTPVRSKFHLVVLGGSLEHSTAHGSIPFPADGSCIQAVGAVNGEGRRLFYSSCGPNSSHPKPDFVAPVPFASLCRDRAFSGTSAATPQAAGLAALVWARHPSWTAAQVRQVLLHAARDLGPPGHDWETGHGLILLP